MVHSFLIAHMQYEVGDYELEPPLAAVAEAVVAEACALPSVSVADGSVFVFRSAAVLLVFELGRLP